MKRLTIILVVSVVVSAPLIVVIWALIEPVYRAQAEIRVRPIVPRLVFQTEDNGSIPNYDSFVNTQVSLIRSLTVLQRVLDQDDVQGTQWYKNPPQTFRQRFRKDAIPPIERLKDGLSVEPRPETEIVDVSFTDVSAKDAKTIVSAVVEQYMRYTGERSDSTQDALNRQLVDQYKALESEIAGREKLCAEIRRKLGTETPQELIAGKRLRLDMTQARLTELQNSIALMEWEMKQPAAGEGRAVAAEDVAAEERQPRYHLDAEWRQRDIAVRTIRHEIDSRQIDPNGPDALRARKDLVFAQELLRLRETQLDEQWRDRARAAVPAVSDGSSAAGKEPPLSYRLGRARQEQQILQADLEKQLREFEGLFADAQLWERENRALQNKQELFDAVRQRLEQKSIERNVPGSIELLTNAFAPTEPYQDHRVLLTAGALIPGLCAAAIAAFLTRRRRVPKA